LAGTADKDLNPLLGVGEALQKQNKTAKKSHMQTSFSTEDNKGSYRWDTIPYTGSTIFTIVERSCENFRTL